MSPFTKVLVAIAVVGAIALGLWQSNSPPDNPSSDPPQPTAAPVVTDSRESFVAKEIPRSYPTLLKAMRVLRSDTVVWTSQSGESRKQVLTLNEEGLLIETAISTESSPAKSSSSTESANSGTKETVRMLDTNLDGRMDSITYVDASGGNRTLREPFDETSQYIWDSALAIAIRFGRCCR